MQEQIKNERTVKKKACQNRQAEDEQCNGSGALLHNLAALCAHAFGVQVL